MANKQRGCQNKEVLERMNFLYQAADLLAGKNDVLSCYYGNMCKSVAKKAVVRMEPNIKRTICKKCGLVLKPGKTSSVQITDDICTIQCKKCNCQKSFKVSENYKLWLDNPKSIVEIIHPSSSEK